MLQCSPPPPLVESWGCTVFSSWDVTSLFALLCLPFCPAASLSWRSSCCSVVTTRSSVTDPQRPQQKAGSVSGAGSLSARKRLHAAVGLWFFCSLFGFFLCFHSLICFLALFTLITKDYLIREWSCFLITVILLLNRQLGVTDSSHDLVRLEPLWQKALMLSGLDQVLVPNRVSVSLVKVVEISSEFLQNWRQHPIVSNPNAHISLSQPREITAPGCPVSALGPPLVGPQKTLLRYPNHLSQLLWIWSFPSLSASAAEPNYIII